jgi:hypothetical protein
MDPNPDHPVSEQAYTMFRLPVRLPELALILALAVLVLSTVWDVITAAGSFTEAGVRAAVVAGVSYLAIRCARAGLLYWRRFGRRGGLGPEIERIESP